MTEYERDLEKIIKDVEAIAETDGLTELQSLSLGLAWSYLKDAR